jgi:hypothetical protein
MLYRDIYDTTPIRKTEVCGELVPEAERRLSDGDVERRFSLRPIGRQNGAS